MEVGDQVKYVVDGKVVFTGRLAYVKGRLAGLSTEGGTRVDEVLNSHVKPVSWK